MLLAISERIWQYPLIALSAACESMYGVAIFGPDQALVVGVPDEFEVFLSD